MVLFHNIEKEGQIWSMRRAVLSVGFVTETVISWVPRQDLCCEKNVLRGVLVSGSIQATGHHATILLNSLISFGKEPGPSASRGGNSGVQHPGVSWWTLILHKSESQAAEDVSSGPGKLGSGLTRSGIIQYGGSTGLRSPFGLLALGKLWVACGGVAECPVTVKHSVKEKYLGVWMGPYDPFASCLVQNCRK